MEHFIVIILAGVVTWLSFRLINLKRGIKGLTQAIKHDTIQRKKDWADSMRNDPLSELGAAVADVSSEAELMQASETGRRATLDYLLNQIDDALFVVDERQQVRFSNEAAKLLFPASQSQIGRPLIEICRDHHIDETVQLAIAANGRMQDKIKLANSNRTLFIEAGPVDRECHASGTAWILIRDITAQLENEQVRKDFVANASHELRTPLSIISGYLEILSEDSDDSMIEVMSKHTDRLARIVDDMLTISKLETDDPAASLLRKEVFDIGDCVNGIIERLQLLVDRHRTEIRIELPEHEQRQFYGDRFYWDQVFFNLVENALKQNRRPGLKVTIRVARESPNGRFAIDVIDNGVGIPSNDLEDVFKRFYKVDKNHSPQIKGTGLGLSIVKRAVEAHHGSISVTSQPGKKTCFHLSIPAPPLDVTPSSAPE